MLYFLVRVAFRWAPSVSSWVAPPQQQLSSTAAARDIRWVYCVRTTTQRSLAAPSWASFEPPASEWLSSRWVVERPVVVVAGLWEARVAPQGFYRLSTGRILLVYSLRPRCLGSILAWALLEGFLLLLACLLGFGFYFWSSRREALYDWTLRLVS